MEAGDLQSRRAGTPAARTEECGSLHEIFVVAEAHVSTTGDGREFLRVERAECFRSDKSGGSEFCQAMQRVFFVARVDDEHAVILAHRPVLALDGDAGSLGGTVKRFSTGCGFLDGLS